jgi:hypothetical protein
MPGIRSKIIIDDQARSILPLLNIDSKQLDSQKVTKP